MTDSKLVAHFKMVVEIGIALMHIVTCEFQGHATFGRMINAYQTTKKYVAYLSYNERSNG